MGVTNINELKKMAGAREVELPGWGPDESVTFKLRRPSFMNIAAKGKIPNGLLGAAQKMFTQTVDGDVDIQQIAEVMDVIVEEALLDPTYKELKDAQIELTDQQMTLIFEYTQEGIRALERFRNQQRSNTDNQHSGEVQETAE